MKHVVDTHAPTWHLIGSSRLGLNAKAVLSDPESEIVLPGIAYAEMGWIVEHGRVPTPTVDGVRAAIDADPRITIHPLDRAVVDKSQTIPSIREMHDRQIVATALVLADGGEQATLLTHDDNITDSGLVTVIW